MTKAVPKTKYTSIRFPPKLKEEIRVAAVETHRSQADMVEHLIALGLQELKRERALLAEVHTGRTQIDMAALRGGA